MNEIIWYFEMNSSRTTFGTASIKKFKSLNSAGVVPQRIEAFSFNGLSHYRPVLSNEMLALPDKGQILLSLCKWDLSDSNPTKSQNYTIRELHVTDNGQVLRI